MGLSPPAVATTRSPSATTAAARSPFTSQLARVHGLRSVARVDTRPDLSQSRVPAFGTVGRLQDQHAAVRDGRVRLGDHLGPARESRRPCRLLLHRPAGARAVGWPARRPSRTPIADYFAQAQAGKLRASSSSTPLPRRQPHRRPSTPTSAPASGSCARIRRIRTVEALETRGLRRDVRRVGRLLRPCPPARPSRQPGEPVDDENFGQAGFRVPALVASPYARRGYVDHTLYDHTSVLRFLEWRFLGAAAGAGKPGQSWFLTERDRRANNLGAGLASEPVEKRVGIKLDVVLTDPSPGCVQATPGGPGAAVRTSRSRGDRGSRLRAGLRGRLVRAGRLQRRAQPDGEAVGPRLIVRRRGSRARRARRATVCRRSRIRR